MHLHTSENYINNYKNLKKIKNNVILSFTTTPEKIEKIRPMLNSILDQTIRVDKIVLNIPKIYA